MFALHRCQMIRLVNCVHQLSIYLWSWHNDWGWSADMSTQEDMQRHEELVGMWLFDSCWVTISQVDIDRLNDWENFMVAAEHWDEWQLSRLRRGKGMV